MVKTCTSKRGGEGRPSQQGIKFGIRNADRLASTKEAGSSSGGTPSREGRTRTTAGHIHSLAGLPRQPPTALTPEAGRGQAAEALALHTHRAGKKGADTGVPEVCTDFVPCVI